MSEMSELRRKLENLEFDFNELGLIQNAQKACIEALARGDAIVEKQLNAQRECLEALVNSVESLQRQIDSAKRRERRSTEGGYMPQRLPRR